MTVTAVSPAEAGVKMGDFFYSSWGYDQTNVDFYKVVGLTPKGVKVQKWSNAATDDGRSSERVVPGAGPATFIDWSAVDRDADYWTQQEQKVERPAAIQTKRLSSYDGGHSVHFNLTTYSSGRPWDGTPQYQTAHGAGH